MDAFDVSLTKNAQGLGITIAGYVGDKNSGAGCRGTGSARIAALAALAAHAADRLLSPQSPRAFS